MNQLHLLARRRVWILPVLLVVLLAGHSVILYYGSSHRMLTAAVLSGAISLLSHRAKRPAAAGMATILYPAAHHRFCTIFR